MESFASFIYCQLNFFAFFLTECLCKVFVILPFKIWIKFSQSTLHVCSSVNVSCMACQMTAGRCHTLLSPVTEESGEEGTNSEVSSPPVCRSPSPITHTEASMSKVSSY